MNFDEWWDTEANTPAPSTFKNWEDSCRQAYQAGRDAMKVEAARCCRNMKQECSSPESMQASLNRQMMSCADAIGELK